MTTTLLIEPEQTVYWCSKCNTRFRYSSIRRFTTYDIKCDGGYHTMICSTPTVNKIQDPSVDKIIFDDSYNISEPKKPKNPKNKKNQPSYTNLLKHYGKNKRRSV